MDHGCVFCQIVAGTAPASIVYADELVLAFCDILPFTQGHALVVPRRHAAGLSDVDSDSAARMFAVGQQVAAAAKRSFCCPGVNLFLADGAQAWQTVFHLHLHVIPRWGPADRMKLVAKPTRPARAELDRTAAQLASGLSSSSP